MASGDKDHSDGGWVLVQEEVHTRPARRAAVSAPESSVLEGSVTFFTQSLNMLPSGPFLLYFFLSAGD